VHPQGMRKLLFIAMVAACSDPTLDDISPDAGTSSVEQPLVLPPRCPPIFPTPVQHSGSITTSETWSQSFIHDITGNLTISNSGTTLTLEPCTNVRIASGASITVGTGASISALGSVNFPIKITPRDPTPWGQLVAYGSLAFSSVSISGGDGSQSMPKGMVVLRNGSSMSVANVALANSVGYALNIDAAPGIAVGSHDLTISGAGDAPVRVLADLTSTLPNGVYTGNARDEIVVAAGSASKVAHDQTWNDLGVPYHIGDGSTGARLDIRGNTSPATLTLAPNVLLRFELGGVLNVDTVTGSQTPMGNLIAVGTAAKPIRFGSADPSPAPGNWVGIFFNGAVTTSKLDFVLIGYAGMNNAGTISGSCKYAPPADQVNDAIIRFTGPIAPSTQMVTNTIFIGSADHGVDRGWTGSSAISFLPTNQFFGIAPGRCKETMPTPAAPNHCPTPPMNPPCP
jgi:hypothetical protein